MLFLNRFPKEKSIKEQWLSFCGIKEEILNTATFLCSHHFKKEDLKQKSNCTIVISGAIPSNHISKKLKKRYNFQVQLFLSKYK